MPLFFHRFGNGNRRRRTENAGCVVCDSWNFSPHFPSFVSSHETETTERRKSERKSLARNQTCKLMTMNYCNITKFLAGSSSSAYRQRLRADYKCRSGAKPEINCFSNQFCWDIAGSTALVRVHTFHVRCEIVQVSSLLFLQPSTPDDDEMMTILTLICLAGFVALPHKAPARNPPSPFPLSLQWSQRGWKC